jgi:hypothetical protein
LAELYSGSPSAVAQACSSCTLQEVEHFGSARPGLAAVVGHVGIAR